MDEPNKIIKEYFIQVIKIIKDENDSRETKRFDDTFLKELITWTNEGIDIQWMIEEYNFSKLDNDYFKKFIDNFYHFQTKKENILYNIHNLYEIKDFHISQIMKYFNKKYGVFKIQNNEFNFIEIISSFINSLGEKMNIKDSNKINEFEKFKDKWWIYYMKATGEYEKLKKVIIQRIMNNNILKEKIFDSRYPQYKCFEKFYKEFSIVENSKISKLLFLALSDKENAIKWFTIFISLEVKDYKENNEVIKIARELSILKIDQFLNKNPNVNYSSLELLDIMVDIASEEQFLHKVILTKCDLLTTDNLLLKNNGYNLFYYIIYLLKYNNQEAKINKFITIYFNSITQDIKDYEKLNAVELKNEITKNTQELSILEPNYDNKLHLKSFENIFKIKLNYQDFKNYKFTQKPTKETINYIKEKFDNDVDNFCKKYLKNYFNKSNINQFFEEKDFLDSRYQGLNWQFIEIYLTLKNQNKLSEIKNNELISYFISKFESLYEGKYIIIKTNYERLDKKSILNDINKNLDDKFKFKNISDVHNDVWRTFIEYGLLSYADVKKWSVYERDGDAIYAMIINKLIVQGHLREVNDKSIYESSLFQDKILKNFDLKKYLVSLMDLNKYTFKKADYLEHLLFALHKNYGFEYAESLLINLLKETDNFIKAKKRNPVDLARVPTSCLDDKKDNYYERIYFESFAAHNRLLESIQKLYSSNFQDRNLWSFKYISRINIENSEEIFETLTKFFESPYVEFEKYFIKKYKNGEDSV